MRHHTAPFRERNRVWKKESHTKIHIITDKKSHPQVQKSNKWKWFVVSSSLSDHWNEKRCDWTRGLIFWTLYKWSKETDLSRFLPTHCLCQPQGKTETIWDSQLTTCSRTGACSVSLRMFAKQIGQKSLSCVNCKSMMTGKQMMHPQVLTCYFL